MDLTYLKETLEKTLTETVEYVNRRQQTIEGYLTEIKAAEQQIRHGQRDDDQYFKLIGQLDYKVHMMMIEWSEGQRQWLRTQHQLGQIDQQTKDLEMTSSLGPKLALTTVIPLLVLWTIKPLISVAGMGALGVVWLGVRWRNRENEGRRSQFQQELLNKKQEVENSAERWETYRNQAAEIVKSLRADNIPIKDSSL